MFLHIPLTDFLPTLAILYRIYRKSIRYGMRHERDKKKINRFASETNRGHFSVDETLNWYKTVLTITLYGNNILLFTHKLVVMDVIFLIPYLITYF